MIVLHRFDWTDTLFTYRLERQRECSLVIRAYFLHYTPSAVCRHRHTIMEMTESSPRAALIQQNSGEHVPAGVTCLVSNSV